MSFFEAISIEKKFGEFTALDDVSIHIPEGSLYGLLGPNGAGKTTLIRIINRITGPDSGELYFRNRKFRHEDLKYIGYLPEERGLYRKMKVGEQALYLSRLKGLSKTDAQTRLKQWFEKFEMTHWWNKKIEELSKGMAQKVQFIITVLHDPEFLIFDEPFSGFDPVNAGMLKREVLELQKKGTTIVFSTHDMASVEELCDHITLIDHARTVLEGSVNDIRQQFKENLFEIEFSGDPELLKSSLNGNFDIPLPDRTKSGSFLTRIRLNSSLEGNELLKKVIDKVQVLGFREVLPTMNEVFIKAVSKTHKPTLHE
jgi:ABC-2 type transport system ATP-binding protein